MSARKQFAIKPDNWPKKHCGSLGVPEIDSYLDSSPYLFPSCTFKNGLQRHRAVNIRKWELHQLAPPLPHNDSAEKMGMKQQKPWIPVTSASSHVHGSSQGQGPRANQFHGEILVSASQDETHLSAFSFLRRSVQRVWCGYTDQTGATQNMDF